MRIKTCKFEGCGRPGEYYKSTNYYSSWCPGHKKQRSRGQELRPLVKYHSKVCRLCGKVARDSGLCSTHKLYLRIGAIAEEVEGRKCEVPKCQFLHYGKGLCYMHYQGVLALNRTENTKKELENVTVCK